MTDFLDLVKRRKSVRSFENRPVPRELIEKIIEAATYAPTNCNQQLWNFVVVDDRDTLERLVREAASSTILRRVPATIVITYDGWNYKEAIQGASLALGHILFTAEYYSLSAGPMNSYGADAEVKRVLNIPGKEVICCFVNIGYPDARAEKAPLVPRRNIQEVLHWGKFNTLRNTPPFTYNPDDWTLEALRSHQRHYCRKTFPGKEMDIMSSFEREIVSRVLASAESPIVDVFSYDGAYLSEFPDVPIITLDFTPETSYYTKAAAALTIPLRAEHLKHMVYDEKNTLLTTEAIKTITVIYKMERLGEIIRNKLFEQIYATLPEGGRCIIIARKRNIFLSFFFLVLRIFFGKDLRKTGIYNFFGPYQPIRIQNILSELRIVGFTHITWSGYFLFPTFYEQVYQMFLQYIKSHGSSYLHRDRRENFLTRLLTRVYSIQGFRKFGYFGSVAVISIEKTQYEK